MPAMSKTMTCQICRKDSDRPTCVRCVTRTRQNLADLLQYQSQATGAPIGAGRNGRTSEVSLGVSIKGLDSMAAFDYVAVLEMWEKDWRTFFNLTPYGVASEQRNKSTQAHRNLRGIVSFLDQWVHMAADRHPAFRDFFLEVKALLAAAKQAVNETDETKWRVTCPATTLDGDDGDCENTLWVSKEQITGEVHCKKCDTNWRMDRLLRVLLSSKQGKLWVDPEAASMWIGVSTRDLRRMAQAGKIKRNKGQYDLLSIKLEDKV